MSERRRAVFLDRDGTLNYPVVREGRPYPPASLAEMELIPFAREVCANLRASGYLLILVTNQPDIARGSQTLSAVNEMNGWMQQELSLDDVWLCPHDSGDGCLCRKPSPGMLTQAANLWNINLAESFMVGDRWRDIEAGRRAGCRTVLIDYQYDEQRAAGYDQATPDLVGAAAWILSTNHPVEKQ
jgi:D-glycero-D-manno-heptose 1,7-bisphosphate phosphatase